MKKAFLFLAALGCAWAAADENEWFVPLGPPPAAAPRNISGGEAVPPLPLPATPLRRTERKRQPSPPMLAGKAMWGETAEYTYETGETTQISDWNLCPGDLQQVLAKAGGWFGLPYGQEAVSLTTFHGDPQRTALLLFSGVRTLKLDPAQLDALRSYVLKGGMLLFDSIAGSPYFYESSKQAVAQMFPELTLREVPPDHAVYHLFFNVSTVKFPKNSEADAPLLEAVYIGCRLGAVVSRYGLGCGWDNHEVPFLEKAVYYDVDSANQIGMNLMAYAVGYAEIGREEAKPELFGAIDDKRPSDEFVFAQIRHGGAWNVHPGGAAALLRRLRQTTSLRVNLRRMTVTPGEDDLSPFPFLYLTGLDDFRFDDRAVGDLRRFLARGGTLLINNGLGMKAFDAAVRRELKRILPDADLSPVAADHALYQSAFSITAAAFAPAAFGAEAAETAPRVEGIAMDGDLRVLYSPFDMECAWLGCEPPLARAYEPHSGLQLGINAVLYAMTH